MITPSIKSILLAEPFEKHLSPSFNWNRFFQETDENGLSPAFHLLTKDSPLVPAAIKAQAKKKYENAIIYKDYCRCKLLDLKSDLCSSGRVVITKGMALNETIYPEPNIRPMGDIDLYFPDGNIDKVRESLLKNGFSAYRSYKNVLKQGELVIDLHQDLWNSNRIPARNSIISGVQEEFKPSMVFPGFFIPSLELLAIHSAFHGLKHGFSRKIWLLDMILLFKAGFFDSIITSKKYPFVLYALDYLAHEGMINGTFSDTRLMTSLKKNLLFTILGMNEKAGAGEIALTLTCPSLFDSIRYLASSALPPKTILEEMYGEHSYAVLIGRRGREVLSLAVGAKPWKKT
jgi:hypothetical protein